MKAKRTRRGVAIALVAVFLLAVLSWHLPSALSEGGFTLFLPVLRLGGPSPDVTPTTTSTSPTATVAGPTATTASPTATSGAGTLEVLSYSAYLVLGTNLEVVGEVRNNSAGPMEFVRVSGTLLDDQGGAIGSPESSYTVMEVLPAGGRSPFEITFRGYTGHASIAFGVTGQAGGTWRDDLLVENVNDYVEPGRDWLYVTGQVRNAGSTPATYVTVIGTLHDADGVVLDYLWERGDPATLAPGGTASFTDYFNHAEGWDHYVLVAEGSD